LIGCIDLRRAGKLVPQDLANLRERGAVAEHLYGEGMAKQVGPFARWMKPGADKGPSDDITDGAGTGKPLPRCPDAKEYAARRTARSPLAQVSGQGLTDVLGDGEPIAPETLAPHHELSTLPVYVIELHMNHLSGTQAEPCQKEQNRIVAPACGSRSIAALEETLYVLRLKKLREVRQPPACHRRDLTSLVEKAEEAAQGGCYELGTSQAHPVRIAHDEPGDVPWRELIQSDRFTPKTLGQKRAGYGKIVVYGRLGEATLLGKIQCETLFDSMKRALHTSRSTTDDAGIAQMAEESP
jgi:hypothetical protein